MFFRSRIFPTVAGAITLGLGLGVRAFLVGWFAKYSGVALWSTLVYFLVLWVSPAVRPLKAFLICCGIGFAVELFQLTPVPLALSEVHPVFALILGTTFHAPDLPAYVIGSGLGLLVHAGRSRDRGRPR